jgi:hypothetical protein
MKVAELVKISMEALKMMSNSGIKIEDWQHIEMYEEYMDMRKNCEKFRYIIAYLAEKYKTSESTIKRVVKRLSREVTM